MNIKQLLEALSIEGMPLTKAEATAIAEKLKAAEELAETIQGLSDFQELVRNSMETDATGERTLLRELRVGDAWRNYLKAGNGNDSSNL